MLADIDNFVGREVLGFGPPQTVRAKRDAKPAPRPRMRRRLVFGDITLNRQEGEFVSALRVLIVAIFHHTIWLIHIAKTQRRNHQIGFPIALAHDIHLRLGPAEPILAGRVGQGFSLGLDVGRVPHFVNAVFIVVDDRSLRHGRPTFPRPIGPGRSDCAVI